MLITCLSTTSALHHNWDLNDTTESWRERRRETRRESPGVKSSEDSIIGLNANCISIFIVAFSPTVFTTELALHNKCWSHAKHHYSIEAMTFFTMRSMFLLIPHSSRSFGRLFAAIRTSEPLRWGILSCCRWRGVSAAIHTSGRALRTRGRVAFEFSGRPILRENALSVFAMNLN